jgi:hypothetical protein
MTLEFWTEFLGWMTLVNGVLLIVATLFLAIARDWIMGMHTALTGVDRRDLPKQYFSYLANYKIAIIVLNLVPFLILRLAM